MKYSRLILLMCFSLFKIAPGSAQTTSAQEIIEIQGIVVDAENQEPLGLSTIRFRNQNLSTVTNAEGYFLLKIPTRLRSGFVEISFLGYQTKTLPVTDFGTAAKIIALEVAVTPLAEVNVVVPRNPEGLVREVMRLKSENYLNSYAKMTAFYRETIRKRRRNVALTEAVVSVFKSPYHVSRSDALQIYKARKKTDYTRLDTLTLKLQGGPFNALYQDLMKYQDFIFSEEGISDYIFRFDRETQIDAVPITVISFKQRPEIEEPLYQGKLYIDRNKKVLVSAIYSINLTHPELAEKLFVKRKPARARVTPKSVTYRVDYREKNNLWYYGYSNAVLEFKVDWDKQLFNSLFTLTCEMAITDWEFITEQEVPKSRDLIKSTLILSDEADGFADPDFWGEYNIIEPDKTIETAIRKIQRQLKPNSEL